MRYTILILVGSVLLFLIINFFGIRSDKKQFNKFYNSTIKGKLTYFNERRGTTDIIINKQKFRFVPFYMNINDAFSTVAKKGDSIYKAAKADTLQLNHNGKIYKYTFTKF